MLLDTFEQCAVLENSIHTVMFAKKKQTNKQTDSRQNVFNKFKVYGSVHRKYNPLYIQRDATLHSLFIYGNCSTCFECYFHPSLGAHANMSTASGSSSVR
jgi:hypothetical protein